MLLCITILPSMSLTILKTPGITQIVQGEPKGLVDETQYEEPQISVLVLKARASISNKVRYHIVKSV